MYSVHCWKCEVFSGQRRVEVFFGGNREIVKTEALCYINTHEVDDPRMVITEIIDGG